MLNEICVCPDGTVCVCCPLDEHERVTMISVASDETLEIVANACVPETDKVVKGELEGPVPEIVTSAVLIEVGELPAALLAVALAVHRSPPRNPVLVTDL